MAISKLPNASTLSDEQFLQIQGPNGITSGYQYDAQQRALYFKESQVLFPNFHGQTHISSDPIPKATCDSPGLMASDDKCKLDALLQTRLGVLGFQGAGFPDDGGWLQGDIILAAGTEFISLERIGNVVRFTVDSPIPLNCACEECTQIFWVQDETDISAIRPPVCSGRLCGANYYGEMKVFLFPDSTIVDPNDPSLTLNNKDQYPAFIFKRYDDTIVPGAAEHEMILKRDDNNTLVTEVGWAFTPGALGVPEMAYYMGKDNDGNQITFNLDARSEPGLLGSILYKGHLITKKMGVVVNYTNTILNTNQYVVREWNVDSSTAIGNSFTATNVWQYDNPENTTSGINPKTLLRDNNIDLLPIGTLVDIWQYQIGEIAGEPLYRYYFSNRPHLNPKYMWAWAASVQFGDVLVARDELQPGSGQTDKSSSVNVPSSRDFENGSWGLTNYDEDLYWYDATLTGSGTEGEILNDHHKAQIDPNLPGLRVEASANSIDHFSERPVWLWNRQNYYNSLTRIDIGRPDNADFVPLDIAIRANIDEHHNKYLRVLDKGVLDNGLNYIRVCGAHFHDLPPRGVLRIISDSSGNINKIYKYYKKHAFPSAFTSDNCDSLILSGSEADNIPYVGAAGDILELLHEEYNSHIVRTEFAYNPVTGLIALQFKVGILDMSLPYEEDDSSDNDDYIRGLRPGYAVSGIYTQSAPFSGVGEQPTAAPSGFVAYDGGAVTSGSINEFWNRLEIMVRDDQLWLWWNELLISPNPTLSSSLPSPVTVDTPYFPLAVDPDKQLGKIGLRMWPGTKIRRMDIRSQLTTYSEFNYGQLEVT